jgi:hypothetical protein
MVPPLLALLRERYHRADDWYQQRWFRYGQASLRSGTLVPNLQRLREHSVPDHDIAPGVMVVQKDAERDRVHLWVGAVLYDQLTDTVEAQVDLAPRDRGDLRCVPVTLHRFGMESEKAVTGWAPGTRFFHAHVTVDGLPPDAWFAATVTIPEPARRRARPLTASCRARTLPGPLPVGGPPLRVFTASCYDVDTDRHDLLDRAYSKLFAGAPGPDLTWVLGDATYADAPFWLYGTMARFTPRTYALLEYWAAWGMQLAPDTDPDADDGKRRPGMRSLLTNGPNWFLADDHEFWNNWPHATVTSRHSYGNMVRAVVGITRRAFRDTLPIADDATVAPPDDPGPAPKDALVQNYLPVHPDEWGRWIRAAFDLVGSFETRSVRDREAGRITWGDRDDDDPARPPRRGPRGVVHRPLNQVLQTIDLGDVQVALLDTRTRRTRKLRHPLMSAFVDEEFLDGMLDVARRAPIFVLVMPEPALVRPAWRPGVDAREPRFAADIGLHDYWHQYERLWTGLVAARAGRPTITVGGDIHRSYVAHAPTISLVEVVASPMSPVFGQALLTLGADGVRRFKNTVLRKLDAPDPFAPGSVIVEVDDLLSGPKDLAATLLPDGKPGGQAVSLACLPRPTKDEGGFALLELDRPDEHRYRLVTTLHDRNKLAEGDRTGDRAAVFDLRTDVRGPGSVTARNALVARAEPEAVRPGGR